jgi:hypothetical protein
MVRKRAWIVLVVVVLAVAVIAWLHRGPDPTWPQCEYFRCATCDTPASIDPDCVSRWGCRECGFVTYRLRRHFWRTHAHDYATPQDFQRAQRRAGVWSACDEWEHRPAKAWLDCY